MRPMLATAAAVESTVPAGQSWWHEVKWDGMRVLADVHDGRLRLTSRTESDVTAAFPELAALVNLSHDFHLDGEIVMFQNGRPNFALLANRMHVRDIDRASELAARHPAHYLAFDVLRSHSRPLLTQQLTARRNILTQLVKNSPRWSVPDVFDDGEALLAATAEQQLEGIVSKRADSTYQPGRRSRAWIKRAHRVRMSCLVGGWRPQVGTQDIIGALLLGVPDGAGFTFAGRVGSGIGPRISAALQAALKPLAQANSPFQDALHPADTDGTRWVKPRLWVDVTHSGRGPSGRLRHPVLVGIRPDLPT
ncbi:MAG: non-homologous end-joining DNA ligase [Actinomycetota bacterium]